MKIEAGKHYVLRNGDTAYIYEVDIGEHSNIAGKVTPLNGHAQVTTWTKNGLWSMGNGLPTNPWDIIKPVCESREECWHNAYPDGFMSDAYKTQAEADEYCLNRAPRGRIKIVWEDNKIVAVDWSNACEPHSK